MAQAYKIIFFCVFVTSLCVVFAEEKRTVSETIFAKNFLRRYHYLSPLKSGNHDWKTALQLYQDLMQLPVTGKLDDATLKEMRKPRCGFPDVEEDYEGTGITKRFGISAQPWSSSSLTYGFVNYCQDLTQSVCENIISKAFKVWSDSSVLTFTKVSDISKATIKIAFVRGSHGNCPYSFDGKNGVLAHAQYPTGGEIHFDEDEVFTDNIDDPLKRSYDLFSVAVHEVGHVVGVAHSVNKSSIMHPEYEFKSKNIQLHQDDKNAVDFLYAGGTAKPFATQPSHCADNSPSCAQFKFMCDLVSGNMKKNCPYTCGHCSALNSNCVDKIHIPKWCQAYKDMGFCGLPSIKANCMKTCDVC